MATDPELLRKIVRVMNDFNKQNNQMFAYGTVENGTNGKRYVKMDGSDNLVPIEIGTDVQKNDRVLVRIENHKAIVVGNLSTPASARTATAFMRFQENSDGTDGVLYIGKLDTSGDPSGSYVAISPEEISIMRGGVKWAELGKSSTKFYANGYEVSSYGSSGVILKSYGNEVARFDYNGVVLKNNGIDVARFTKDYTDIRKGIRLLDDYGNIHSIVTVEYVSDSDGVDHYSVVFGTQDSSQVTETTIIGDAIYLVGGPVFIDNGKRTLESSLYIIGPNGPTDVISYLKSLIPSSSVSQYTTSAQSGTYQSGANIGGPTIYLSPGYYILFGLVQFTETSSSAGKGVRKAIIEGYNTSYWWETQQAVGTSGLKTEVSICFGVLITSYGYWGVMGYQNSGAAINQRMSFKAIKVGDY